MKSPQKSFVQYFRSPSNDRTKRNDTRYRSRRHELIFIIKTQNRKTDVAPHPETDSVTTKILFLYNTLDHDTTTTKEIHDHTALLQDLLTDLPTDMTLVIDLNYDSYSRDNNNFIVFQDIHLPKDHLPDHEILDILDHVHIQIQEINSIQHNQNIKQTQLILKYTCITQLTWQKM